MVMISSWQKEEGEMKAVLDKLLNTVGGFSFEKNCCYCCRTVVRNVCHVSATMARRKRWRAQIRFAMHQANQTTALVQLLGDPFTLSPLLTVVCVPNGTPTKCKKERERMLLLQLKPLCVRVCLCHCKLQCQC